MRISNFAKRNFKEIARDPLSLIFAVILPLFLLFIFQQFDIPNDSYKLENFTPGIIIFGFSFITMFTAMLISKDRTTSLLIRLGISPMKPADYILGYMLSIIPVILIQNILFFVLNSKLYSTRLKPLKAQGSLQYPPQEHSPRTENKNQIQDTDLFLFYC